MYLFLINNVQSNNALICTKLLYNKYVYYDVQLCKVKYFGDYINSKGI